MLNTKSLLDSASTALAIGLAITAVIYLVKLRFFTKLKTKEEDDDGNSKVTNTKATQISDRRQLARQNQVVNCRKDQEKEKGFQLHQEILDKNFDKTYRSKRVAIIFLKIQMAHDLILSALLIFVYHEPKIQVGVWGVAEVAMIGLVIDYRPYKSRLMTIRTIIASVMLVLIGLVNVLLTFHPKDKSFSLAVLMVSVGLMLIDLLLAVYILAIDFYTMITNCRKKESVQDDEASKSNYVKEDVSDQGSQRRAGFPKKRRKLMGGVNEVGKRSKKKKQKMSLGGDSSSREKQLGTENDDLRDSRRSSESSAGYSVAGFSLFKNSLAHRKSVSSRGRHGYKFKNHNAGLMAHPRTPSSNRKAKKLVKTPQPGGSRSKIPSFICLL